jgi:hypothetical protein
VLEDWVLVPCQLDLQYSSFDGCHREGIAPALRRADVRNVLPVEVPPLAGQAVPAGSAAGRAQLTRPHRLGLRFRLAALGGGAKGKRRPKTPTRYAPAKLAAPSRWQGSTQGGRAAPPPTTPSPPGGRHATQVQPKGQNGTLRAHRTKQHPPPPPNRPLQAHQATLFLARVDRLGHIRAHSHRRPQPPAPFWPF